MNVAIVIVRNSGELKMVIKEHGLKMKQPKCKCCKQEGCHPVFYRDVNDKFSCVRIPNTWFCTYCGFIFGEKTE